MEPSLKTACDYLAAGLSQNIWQEGQRLPPIPVLARSAAVRTGTMVAALRHFAQEGAITIVKRKGIFRGKRLPRPVRHQAPKRSAKWQSIRTDLARDILENTYSDGALPKINELCRTYGASRPTIRKALKALTDQNIIAADRTRYTATCTIPRSPSPLVFVCKGANNTISIYNDMLHETLHALELECRSRNITLVKIILQDRDTASIKKSIASIDTPLGYMVWSMPFEQEKSLPFMLNLLGDTGRPVALLDENGSTDLPPRFRSLHTMVSLTPSGRLPGLMMGRYLIEHGHRCMAYISGEAATGWSRERLAGIKSACHQAGLSESACRAIDFKLKLSNAMDTAAQILNRKVHNLIISAIPSSRWRFWPVIEPALDSAIRMEYTLRNLPAALNSLWARKEITAWIGDNDNTALCALRFLKDRCKPGGRLPVAVAGFDDLRLSSAYDLTSYHFSCANLVKQAMGFVLNPKNDFYWNKTRIEVEGVIMERGSTREPVSNC